MCSPVRRIAVGCLIKANIQYPTRNFQFPSGEALRATDFKNQKGRMPYLDIGHWILIFQSGLM